MIIICIVVLLTGCWDERLLRNSRTVYLSGIDFGNNERYMTTSIIRDMNISEASRGEISITNQLETGEGNSVKETSMTIDRSVAGNFDPAKGRIMILGSEVAKEDLNNLFDSIYRDARINISARLVVTDISANELIVHLQKEESEKGEYLYEMIRSTEKHTEAQYITLRSVRTYLFDEGKDFTLPYLGIDEESNKVKVKGAALFHGPTFTGEFITPDESTLLLLFMGVQSKKAVLTEKLNEDKNQSVSFNVKNVTKEQQLKKEEKVHANIAIQLDVEIVDYPPGHLDEERRVELLNKQLSAILTKKAENLFEKLEDSQSDVLGLGRELMARHPEIWDEIKGDHYYEHILVLPKVNVRVTSGGATL